MTRKKKIFEHRVDEKELEFFAETKKKKVFNVFGYSVVGIISFLVILLVIGSYVQLPNFLEKMGFGVFRNEGKGLWLDCSIPANKKETYCKKLNRKPKSTYFKGITVGKGGKRPPFTIK